MVDKTSGIPLGPSKPLTPLKGITHVRHHDREDRLVPDRKKKTPDKKHPGVSDDEQETPEGSKDNKIDIRA
ncbi:hypothetical protein MNBD_DELTA01-378 [hydrothermal vent metagenome]|uniref:Uncharacterized protein n=1 Tax=hydrothermal vent metagenome TaxID=652676 RepID=A0A3B0QZS0_9ZZZZ